MAIQIYNTMTRSKEVFEPREPGKVAIYNCGPTVYDHFHIGNARNFVVMDIVRRYFEYRGFAVRFIQNLTDIDDKIIDRANKEGRSSADVTAEFIPNYFDDAKKLRIREANVHPKATEHIPEIIALIGKLVERGLAYEAAGSVYYNVRGFKDYGKLSRRNLDDMQEGERVDEAISGQKRDTLDFALWKAAKPGEPTWDSPWGPGRPGWHIECSCMAMKHLGETIDIHSGGTDLTFPHHENEIAQSEGATGVPFARYWMHNGFLNINKQKMSKSLGNFLKIDQMLERASAPVLRHLLMSGHYRAPLDLTDEALEQSTAAVARITDGLQTAVDVLKLEGRAPGGELAAEDAGLRERFETAMDDDFNTPQALAVLFDVIRVIHETRDWLKSGETDKALGRLAGLTAFGMELQAFFGLQPEGEGSGAEDDGLTESLMQLLIETRALARKAKAFDIADRIRAGLGEIGITLDDHPQGTVWKKTK